MAGLSRYEDVVGRKREKDHWMLESNGQRRSWKRVRAQDGIPGGGERGGASERERRARPRLATATVKVTIAFGPYGSRH